MNTHVSIDLDLRHHLPPEQPCRAPGRLAWLVLAVALRAVAADAQPAPSGDGPGAVAEARATDATLAAPPTEAADQEERPCAGCPPRRLGRAFLQATIINGFYELANLIRGQDTAKITPKTWWTNMKRGWEWDLDDFVVNQIGHPYQGNNYFNAGRANGLSFWESAAITAFGSGTWEYFGETNQASLNDFINTTLGGIALGEMFHRTAWLVRNTQLSGKARLWNEIAATAIDPVTGANRFISGDASRVGEKPREMTPSSLGTVAAAGATWRGSNNQSVESETRPYFELDVLYGDPTTGRSRTPYDAFAVRMTFGGGGPVSEAQVRGRLFGHPLKDGAIQFTISQAYQFNSNDAYRFGAQAVEGNVMFVKRPSPRVKIVAAGWGGATILGAVDSLPPGETKIPDEAPPDPSAGQGVSTGPRFYDYGPGSNAGGLFTVMRQNTRLLTAAYELHHLYVVDGIRANHLLQHTRVDGRIPLRGPWSITLTGEYFDRRTFYHTENSTPAHFHFPQVRAALSWSTP